MSKQPTIKAHWEEALSTAHGISGNPAAEHAKSWFYGGALAFAKCLGERMLDGVEADRVLADLLAEVVAGVRRKE